MDIVEAPQSSDPRPISDTNAATSHPHTILGDLEGQRLGPPFRGSSATGRKLTLFSTVGAAASSIELLLLSAQGESDINGYFSSGYVRS